MWGRFLSLLRVGLFVNWLRFGPLPSPRRLERSGLQYQMNRDRCCVYRLQQILDEGHKVHLGAAGGDLDAAALALGFDGHKDVTRPGPFVFVVFAGTLARLYRDWRTGLPE